MKEEATLAAIVMATAGPVIAQIGLLSWGAMVGGIMAVAMRKDDVSVKRGAWYVLIGVLAAIVIGGAAAHVLPQLAWAKDFGLSPPMLWMPIGFAIGAFWRQLWAFVDRKIGKGGK